MSTVDDLAAWLTQIWDEREKACLEAQEAVESHGALAAEGALELRWMLQLRRGGVFQGGWDMPGPPTPTEDLVRIAADRQILALHAVVVSGASYAPIGPTCSTCGAWEEYPEDWPCQTVKLLALPHAGRPGYREEWKP